MKEQIYSVSGMSCAGCAARVERTVAALPGVIAVQVNLLAKSMRVCGEGVEDSAVQAAVRRIGFAAEPERAEVEPQKTGPRLGRRAAVSLLLLVPLVVAHVALHHGPAWGAWVQLLLVLPIVWLNRSFFVRGIAALRHGGPGMDTLVALGAGVALVDGVVQVLLGSGGTLFFESAGMILAFVSIGKWLESCATQRTGRALEQLAALLPATATLLRGGKEVQVPAEWLAVGDEVLVRPGECVPADGTVVQGDSAVNEAALTGESMPVTKEVGDQVYAGTVNQHGALHIKVACARADYALSGVIRLVRRAAGDKAPVARLADRLAAVFVPLVLVLGCTTALAWWAAGASWDFAMARAVAVLVISCPCALGLATPVAIMVGAGRGAEWGILFRSGAALETTGRCTCAVLDKTGTLTLGEPRVTDVLPREGSADELLQLAAALEADANHPLAKALRQTGVTPLEPVCGHVYRAGRGVQAQVQGCACAAGNAAFMHELGVEVQEDAALMAEGKTLIFIARSGRWVGALAIADAPRPTAAEAVQELGAQGVRVLMMTGDHADTAHAIAARVGVAEVHAGALPADKEALVHDLQRQGQRVAMVGDGINDAPALARADVGIAIGAGADIAIESADVILMHSDPRDIARAMALSRATLRKIRQNLFLALIYNMLAIPLAAGVFYPVCGLLLPPGVAAAAMGLSSVCVVVNALSLRRFQVARSADFCQPK